MCERGMARVVDTLPPGIVAFCAPVFDGGHLALGITTLGSCGRPFDPEWVAPSRCPARCRRPAFPPTWRAGSV